MVDVGSWPVHWAPYGRLGGVAGPLGFVWPLWGRGMSSGSRMADVGAWPVSWAPYGRHRDVAGFLGLV